MPKLTIYVPDDLAERLHKANGLNVSAICQRALRQELQGLAQFPRLSKNYNRDRGKRVKW